MFDTRCIDCLEPIHFGTVPGAAICAACGTSQYVTEDRQTGRYPDPEIKPGGIQGKNQS